MTEESISTNNPQNKITIKKLEPCAICRKIEGEYLFYHARSDKWYHKSCFEDFTCKNSISKLGN
ncbi:MAG: hypothetical protein K9W44_11645 [Candidatus Lokiarchaeota archaeon]|nr:hypothetical protein [Candidatus Harpocratesius repetitus]